MNRLIRVLLGITVVSLLIPVIAFAFPGTIDRLWSSGTETGSEELVTANSMVEALAETDSEPQATTTASPVVETTSPALDPTPPDFTLAPDPPDEDTGGADESTTTSSEEPASTVAPSKSKPATPTTTAAPVTTATTSDKSVASNPVIQVGATITGTACPCTVTGTTQLKGNVVLQGDLTVDGGLLIARPGVSVNGNGYQILFTNGGRADFQGTKTSTWSGNGSSANLQRDINFTNMRRILFIGGAGASTLKYFTVSDSGGSSMGEYPIHFHLNGNSTRGTIVEGVVVVNGRNHAFVPHGSHGITFRDTIAKNIRGDAFWWDAPGTNESCSHQKQCTLDNSNDTVIDHALVDGVTNGPGDNRGWTLTAYLLGAGSGNVIRNSVARNINPSNVLNCSGFHWPESANQNVGGNVWVFQNNRSYSPSGCHGIFVWQNDGNRHIVDGFAGDGIGHGAYVNKYEYRNLDVSYFQVHALGGWSVTSGSVGDVVVLKHTLEGGPVTFTNVGVRSLTINNATDGGSIPGTYIFQGTGLTCGAVAYNSVVPGTRVIIDGAEC